MIYVISVQDIHDHPLFLFKNCIKNNGLRQNGESAAIHRRTKCTPERPVGPEAPSRDILAMFKLKSSLSTESVLVDFLPAFNCHWVSRLQRMQAAAPSPSPSLSAEPVTVTVTVTAAACHRHWHSVSGELEAAHDRINLTSSDSGGIMIPTIDESTRAELGIGVTSRPILAPD
jgi:hypothetical protein